MAPASSERYAGVLFEVIIMQESWNIIPSHLIPIPNYDGYFFDAEACQLYSIKVSGTLTPLKRLRGIQLNYRWLPARFNVSRRGRKGYLPIDYLYKLAAKERTQYTVPMEKPL